MSYPDRPICDNPPYRGQLVDLLLTGDDYKALRAASAAFPEYILTERQLCDTELILNGGFSPLTGFLNKDDYEGVVNNMRLADGTLWPIPITLDVSAAQAAKWTVGERVSLRDSEHNLIAVLTVESIYEPNKPLEAEKVFGSADDKTHPSVEYLLETAGSVYVGGKLQGFQLPPHYDFSDLRWTPREVRQWIIKQAHQRIVGFQTRNPMHRSHRELTIMAAREAKAVVLIHPVVGMTKPGDVDHYTRVRCYKELMKHYPHGFAQLSLLPLAMRMAGPKEAVLHAIIRKNYGCTHFIVGRDHAGPGNNKLGKPHYDPYEAQRVLKQHAEEIGIQVLYYPQVVYIENLGEYRREDDVPDGSRVLNISGTELRRRLYKGIDIPDWFSFKEVVTLLRQTYPPPSHQGFTIFFTGLSGSGKSTIANALRIALLEEGSRPVTLLDGDKVRRHLSSELGFSKEHRDLNIRRIAYVASEITKARGCAITAAIAPYSGTRKYVRELISKQGGYVEVFISTPIEICEQRDRKGLYAKARAGLLKEFTGVDDPYESPETPEVKIDTSIYTVKQAVQEILLYLRREGFLSMDSE